MSRNPYKYTGPLDPSIDNTVCVPREKDVDTVIKRIKAEDYLAILGPRQIGKTTFLRQLEKKYPGNAHCIFFHFDKAPKSEEAFYPWLAESLNEISAKPAPEITKVVSPDKFYEFLVSFKPKKNYDRIILLFDEVELIPGLYSFLHVLRKIYIHRDYEIGLKKYSLIITGSIDLIKATTGKTSPFNIAYTHYLKDFSDSESEWLINGPFKRINLEIEKEAKEELLSQISGHPQMLQQTCHILFETATEQQRDINKEDVDNALENLMKYSTALDTLKFYVNINDQLVTVIQSVLKNEKNPFSIYKEFSIDGAGPIIRDKEGFCAIRNKMFERFLKDIINTLPVFVGKLPERGPKAFICLSSKDIKWWESFSRYSHTDYHETLFVWESMKGKPEKKLRNEIEENVNSSDISIFLVSDASVTPDFLLQKGLFGLIKQEMKEGKKIFPVIVPTSSWENIREFAELMASSKDQ